MPTSNYMPDVTVAIAFNAGYLTPAASRTWTDISTYVELGQGITINVGRQDERSTADANTLTLTLDNSDGRFTATKTTGPYGANLKLGRPIRVQSDPVDGAIQTEFVGFIDELPVEWADTDGYSYVTITATSLMSRLGTQAALRSIVEQATLAYSPVAYYTLGEPADSTQANDSSTRRADPLRLTGDATAPVTFGNATGPGTDSLTAAQFTGGAANAQSLISEFTYVPNGAAWSLSLFFSATGSKPTLAVLNNPSTSTAVDLVVDAGVLTWGMKNTAGSSQNLTGGSGLNDGNTHHAALTCSAAGALNMYVDGALVDTDTIAGTPLGASLLRLGGPYSGTSVDYLVGALAHAAIYDSVLTAAQVAAISSAGFNGYAGELTSDRLLRYAGYAGIPTASVSAETGQTSVQHLDTTDRQVVDLMRIMEATEGGFLFDAADGTLTFHNRAHRVTASSAYALDMAQQHVEAGYVPKLDRSVLANDVSATNVAGTYSAHVADTTSQTENGVATLSIETASEDDDEPLFQANWALSKYKDPKPRVPTLSIQALNQVGKTPNCSTVMSTSPGDLISVTNHPAQAASSTASYFVEGYTKSYSPESLVITFNLSPSAPDTQALMIGDATRGVIGTNPVAL